MPDPVRATAPTPWDALDARAEVWSARVVRGSAGFAVGLGLAVLVGWTFDAQVLKSVVPGAVSMKPNTAVCVALLGLGLWCSVAGGPASRRLGVTCAVPALAATSLTLTEYVLDVNLFLDRVLFHDSVDTVATSHPGRMAPNTAAALLLLAGAQLALLVERGGGRAVLVSQAMSTGAALLGTLGLYGYLYRVPSMERFLGLTGMAVHTAIVVSVMAVAMLFARPAAGLMRVLTARASSAMLTRRILLPTLVVPPTLVWLVLWGQDAGLYGMRLGVGLLTFGLVLIFTVIAFVAGTRAARLEHARHTAETALARHAQLQTMMDNMPAAIFVKDLTGRFRLVNGEFERQIPGLVSGTAIGRTDADLFDAATAAEARRRDDVVLSAGEAVQFEDVVVDVDGPRTFLTTQFVLRDDAGHAYAIGAIAADITRQRLAEAKFGSLLEAAPDATVCVDTAGLIVLVNKQAERLFGYGREDLLGQPVEILVPELIRETHPGHRQRYVDSPVQRQISASSQLKAQRKDGSEFPVDINLSAVHTEDGMIVTAAVRDVTARRAAEQTNARLAGLVEASDDAIIGKNLDGVILTWNPGAERLYGYSAQEMIGRSVTLLCPSGGTAEEEALLGRVARGEAVKHHETIRLRKDGRRVHVSLSVAPIWDDAGAVIGASSVAHDITDRVRAEATLRVQQQQNRMVVDTASDPFISMDENGVITEWNRRAEEVFGWSRDEVIGSTAAETIVPARNRDPHRDWLRQLRDDGPDGLLEPREVVVTCHDGRELPAELTMWRLEYDGAAVFNAFLRDITARREIEHALASARDQAVQTSRLKSQFLASMSHEIRTPMNAVVGLTGLLLSTDLDDTQLRYAQGVSTAGVALLSIINDILDFSKIEAGKVILEEIDFDLGSLIDDVVEMAAEPARRKPVEVVGRCDPQLPAVARGDASRLRQVLLNLASNAVKFTERGEVIVHASPAEGAVERADQIAVRFEVTDTGIGIAETDRARLFEPFIQADAGTTRRFGGTGLGLAICHDLVQLMGGTIGVQSRPGQGSTFWFTVTLSHAADGAIATRTRPRALNGLRVLVVDDNATNRLVLYDQLTNWGMHPIAVPSGTAALDELTRVAASGHPFDLAILDMQMPGMDGLELARKITADTDLAPMQRVLLSSGHDLTDEDVRHAGFAATLTKPVRQSHLYDILISVLDPGTITDTASRPTVTSGAPTRGHLLLVEDNDLNQDVALGILANLGYTADVAVNGRQAVAMAAAHTYPAILMDCEMPEIDGYTATAEIRRAEGATRHTPIIAMTASALAEDRERCIAAGMDDHIAKPVMPGDISRTLQNWLTQGSPLDAEPPAVAPSGDIHATQTAIEQRLEQLRGPDPDANAVFLPRLLNSMAERAPHHLDDLTQALNDADTDTARRLAHQLKGIAANLGVISLATACHEMETLAGTGALTAAPEVLVRLRAEVADMQAAISSVLTTFDPRGGNPQSSP
jgi:PAS domain S-box-containing protein